MREFLSRSGVPYDDRNVADDRVARAELTARLGEVLVPTLVYGDRTIVGYDPTALEALFSRDGGGPDTGFDGLPASVGADLLVAVSDSDGDEMAARLREFLSHLEHELRVNAAKGSQPYRHGVHDGLRFAADGIRKILAGDLPNEGRRALPGS